MDISRGSGMIKVFEISLICLVFIKLGEPEEIFAFYQRAIDKLPYWVFKPLGGCLKCFTGQVCFWFYLIKHFQSYNILDHLFFVSLGISLSLIYNYLWQKME
jgi:hypothetical protein